MPDVSCKFVYSVIRQALKECLPDGEARNDEQSDVARELFESAQAKAIREEIIRTGRKLWAREYVDGNGGNISCRISHDYVICTPTLCSKGDLQDTDFSLVSLANERVLGSRAHTSEILLHLEIYDAVPEARAVIHCHPPHATAYAITGLIPLGDVIPEQEVFVGPVALSPYDTPGTKAFAETVLPYVRHHNTILLANHGVVCWSDTVTHAEWLVEVVDAYCRTLILASQLGSPIRTLAPEKVEDLLRIKKRLGLPDARFKDGSCSHHAEPVFESQASSKPEPASGDPVPAHDCAGAAHNGDFDALVASIAEQVIRFSANRK